MYIHGKTNLIANDGTLFYEGSTSSYSKDIFLFSKVNMFCLHLSDSSLANNCSIKVQ